MKKPRLTDADRLEIEHGLREGKTMYAIAVALGRPLTTISRDCISEVIDISPGSLDSSLFFFQPSISHDVLCI